MTLSFDPISSPGAIRDLFLDLTGALEPEEVLGSVDVVSGFLPALTISNIEINSAAIEMDGIQVAIGKGVRFTVTTIQESRATIPLTVSFVGSNGTAGKYEIEQPLSTTLCD